MLEGKFIVLGIQRLLIGSILIVLCSAVYGADFTIREWSNDIKLFNSQVLEPVGEQFKSQGCVDKMNVYLGALFSALAEIKASVNSKSYLLLRDSVLTTAADLTPWDEQMSCSIIDRWALLKSHIQNELELIGNVLLIIE